MTREEREKAIIDIRDNIKPVVGGKSLDMAIEALEQEPCEDAISRKAVQDYIAKYLSQYLYNDVREAVEVIDEYIGELPSVKTQEPKIGQWIRMSDLSEQEDDRYKCSHCGNVIHHKNKMNLYTFNSWCGRCGSDNGRKIEVHI